MSLKLTVAISWTVIAMGAPAAAGEFATTVYPVLQKAGCQGCHNLDGVAAATRLHFPEAGASEEQLDAFGQSLHILVDRENPENSLLLGKPTKRVAHAGGQRIVPGSPEEAVLRQWIEQLAKAPVPTEAPAPIVEALEPIGPILRRLTHSQYNNTVRDLLGDDSRVADQFPPEDFVGGFRNQYQAQNTSPLLAEAYSEAAEKLSSKAFKAGAARGLIPCKPSSFSDEACRLQFIRSFGKKAFRRPLTKPEEERYSTLFASEAAAAKDFRAGARIVTEAMLQSPNFLLRTENGLEPKWRPYETASRLSYFLWNSMPDEKLFRSAETGELDTREGVERAARRMIEDPKARQSVNEFVAEWLRFDRVVGMVKERRSFPQYNLELAVAMTEETRRMVSDLVWNDRNFMDFYSAEYSFVSSALASVYGLPAPKEEYDRVALSPETGRAGILGQATFLALTSKPADTSPTARGLFVREQFLCQEVPQPPPGVSSNLPPLSKAKPQTNRERLAMHLNNESCASCHRLIDPIGFGLEKFDALGRKREKQKITFRPPRGEDEDEEPTVVELDLDTTGSVAGIKESDFSSPRELGKILAASAQCQECVAKQLFRYAAGRHEEPVDRIVIRKAFEDFRQSGFHFKELMVSLMKWSIY
ncbi:MAG: DUF1592 domain-containing protein, partial [Bryobacteraceae bacterium]